jgi:hypothetical protein
LQEKWKHSIIRLTTYSSIALQFRRCSRNSLKNKVEQKIKFLGLQEFNINSRSQWNFYFKNFGVLKVIFPQRTIF